jgi:dTDP-glucose 4,6-dehydratase
MATTYVVTGGYGFIGSHIIDELLREPDNIIINIDKCGIGSSIHNLPFNKRIITYIVDLCKTEEIEHIFKKHNPNYVIHCAAESHVDRSINSPAEFINSNIVGTFSVLEAIRKSKKEVRLLHVSTDEVYGHLDINGDPFTELTPIAPRSPYSASKASSDLLVLSYKTTYNIDATITRCCNNFGPRQFKEKFIPTIVQSIVCNKKIPVYGSGENIREWIYVKDHANAILEVLHHHSSNNVYNIWGTKLISNIELIELIVKIIAQKYPKFAKSNITDYYEFVEDRAGHDFKYEIKSLYTCIKSLNQQADFDDALNLTTDFYVQSHI